MFLLPVSTEKTRRLEELVIVEYIRGFRQSVIDRSAKYQLGWIGRSLGTIQFYPLPRCPFFPFFYSFFMVFILLFVYSVLNILILILPCETYRTIFTP